jgi:kumamolisin
VRLSVELAPADPHGLRALADAVSTPDDPRVGRHLGREALAARLAPPPALRDALQRWLGADLDLAALRVQLPIDRPRLACLFGHDHADTLLSRRRLVADDARALVPAALAPIVAALEVGPWRTPASARHLTDPGLAPPPPPSTGLTPADLCRGYDLDDDADGDGETIAVMALGGVPDPADLHGFARAFDLPAPRVELVPLTPLGACASNINFRHETTMSLQWLAAVAPRARIVVYLIDPALALDPWSTFLRHVLSDMSRSPSIAVTSWSAPARQYYPVHGREVFAGLLDRAAALGVTVIAASGDWGAHDGFPRGGPDGASCEHVIPGDTFPGCEARVLSVGGTRITDLAEWREIAWSAPVSPAVRDATGLPALAGSGGISTHVEVPAYQRPWLPSHFSRGPDGPPQPVRGRVQPDVALMAWGVDVPGPDGPRPTACAFLLDGRFRDDGGGTSLAAPIWAGIVARLNQLRRRRDLPRLGQLHPRLYAACAEHRDILRDITEGRTDIELPTFTDGIRAWRTLPGFSAIPGFDPATGLGVPAARRLARALCHD